jgi:hypothetical protein
LVGKRLYVLRSRIECFICHLKERRRIATRYDKTASCLLGFVLPGAVASGSGLSTGLIAAQGLLPMARNYCSLASSAEWWTEETQPLTIAFE